MPDITMCPSVYCPLKSVCYRNSMSGTKPDAYRQPYFLIPPNTKEGCTYFWPVEDLCDDWGKEDLSKLWNTKT